MWILSVKMNALMKSLYIHLQILFDFYKISFYDILQSQSSSTLLILVILADPEMSRGTLARRKRNFFSIKYEKMKY